MQQATEQKQIGQHTDDELTRKKLILTSRQMPDEEIEYHLLIIDPFQTLDVVISKAALINLGISINKSIY